MRIPPRRVTVRRAMAAVAFVASCLAYLRSNIDRPSHLYQSHLRVGLADVAGRGGREGDPTSDDGSMPSGRLTSPAVLDEALKDAHFSTLPRIYNSDDPRAELGRMLSVRREGPAGAVWITISGETPAESFFGAAALDGAIRAKGPPGVVVTRPASPVRMPPPPGLLDRRWKILAATAAAIVVSIAILFAPWPTTARHLVPVLLSRARRSCKDTRSHEGHRKSPADAS